MSVLFRSIALAWFLVSTGVQSVLADTPGALDRYTITHKGWAQTDGGAGGKIIRVTTLASNGPGSL